MNTVEKLSQAGRNFQPGELNWMIIELGSDFPPCISPTVSQVNENELVIVGGYSNFLNAYIEEEALFVLDKDSDDGY